MSKSVLLDQPAEHTNYVSVVLQGETLWGQDAGGTSENMQVEEGPQAPKTPAPLGVPEELWRFLSQRNQGRC